MNTTMLSKLNGKPLTAIKTMVFVCALVPLFKLIALGWLDELGANPIEKIERNLGYWTLSFLLITLAVTPLRRLLGWPWLVRLRRMLGLFAFFYGGLHFLTYLVVDQFFDWPGILKDIVKRPYITIGFAAFLLMMPLAVTSTNAMIRRLGGKRWQRLHRLVYLTAIGGVVHYWWLVKKDITIPATFASLLAVLLGYRLVYAGRTWIAERATRPHSACCPGAVPAPSSGKRDEKEAGQEPEPYPPHRPVAPQCSQRSSTSPATQVS